MDTVIVGAGTTAELVVSILRHDHNIKIVGCVDIAWPEEPRSILDTKVIGDHSVLETLVKKGVRGAIVAVADNGIREKHFYILERLGFELVNAVHPSAVIGSNVTVGRGVCIAEGCLVSAGSQIGDNVILDTGAVVGSHVEVGSNVYIGARTVLGTGAVVGRNCFLDTGVSVARRVRVGKHNSVETGAAVRKSLADRRVKSN